MRIEPGLIIEGLWIVFLAYWLFSSLGAKRNQKGEGGMAAAGRLLLIAAVYVLISRADDPRWGALGKRFLPRAPWVPWLGAVITGAGIAFAIWARTHIGRYWSSSVALKESHKLIGSGPYGRIRHPIYTGILAAIAGTSIAMGRYVALLGLPIVIMVLAMKARKEEALLAGEFGPAFDEHRRRTGFFLPRVFAQRGGVSDRSSLPKFPDLSENPDQTKHPRSK